MAKEAEQHNRDNRIQSNGQSIEENGQDHAYSLTPPALQLTVSSDDIGPSDQQSRANANTFQSPVKSQGNNPKQTLQRTVTPTATDYKSFAEMVAMKVHELESYTNSQVDWHASPQLSNDERSRMRILVELIRRNGVAGACANMDVSELNTLLDTGGPNFSRNLQVYSAAVSNGEPFNLSPVRTAQEALELGEEIHKLIQEFQMFVLRTAMDEDTFNLLKNDNLIDDVISYHNTSTPQPVFQAYSGKDFKSYRKFRLDDSGDPNDYHTGPLQNKIRNFHRFTKAAIEKIRDNFGDTSKTNPLTLILHTALDHNGAFHRDPSLDQVINDPSMLTLMLEGMENMAGYISQIEPIAQAYGQNNQIDQVMVAGHGNSNNMQLGGSIREGTEGNHEGRIEEVNTGLVVGVDPDTATLPDDMPAERRQRLVDLFTNTELLFNTLLDNMDTSGSGSGHNRIMLNACLTASNSVRTAVNEGDQAAAQAEVNTFIQNNPSLRDWVQNLADGRTPNAIDVRGANASYGYGVDYIDSNTHALEHNSPDDPALSSRNKLDYVREGIEPLGAMRAVLECWANDPDATFQAMQTRVRAIGSSTSWELIIIKTCYNLILNNYRDNGEKIRQLGMIAGNMEEFIYRATSRVNKFSCRDAEKGDVVQLLNALKRSDYWRGYPFIPLVLYQVWMDLEPGANNPKHSFQWYLMTHFTCRTARRFVDIAYLENKGFMTFLLNGPRTKAKTILALLGVISSGSVNDRCKQYLVDNEMDAAHNFTHERRIRRYLDNAASINQIKDNMGFGTASQEAANVRLEGESQNTERLQPVTMRKIVVAPLGPGGGADIYDRPDSSRSPIGRLPAATWIQVIGTMTGWNAIEHSYSGTMGTAFIQDVYVM